MNPLKYPIALLVALAATTGLAQAAEAPADLIYTNGRIYTMDAKDSVQESIALRGGKIAYVGSAAGAKVFEGPKTRTIDLKGRSAMPGLVDGHMHPLEAGAQLLKCNLNYEPLTVPEFQKRIQACLDADKANEPNGWLEVVSWFQQAMLPAGTVTTRATLDVLKTSRPILVRDSFGHTVLANSKALAAGNITRATKDPVGGAIEHDASGEPTGLLQDAASEVFGKLLPKPTPKQEIAAARAALKAMNEQGVTSFLDAWANPESLAAFAAVQKGGGLTARGHFAVGTDPAEADHPKAIVAKVVSLRKRYDQGALMAAPTLTVRNAKLFMDGVISGPAFTGAMLKPYLVNQGTAATPRWVEGPSAGPEPYFAPAKLKALLIELASAGIEPHLHVDGDRGVHEALDGIEALRKALPNADLRVGFAHCEIVAPEDYPRFAKLGVFPVLSMQWEKPAPDTVDQLRDYVGPERAKLLEPAGALAKAGAAIAFGSDWPVDRLDEWFALKVGVTRTNSPAMQTKYPGRLGTDPGLTRKQVLRAATIEASRELHQDQETGSLEVGKLADLIVLDRDPMTIPAEEIANVKVLETVVGGRSVYQAPTGNP